MLRFAVVLTWLLAFELTCIAQQATDAKNDVPQKLLMGVWRVPPGFVSRSDPSNENGIRKPIPVFMTKDNPYATQYDASAFLKTAGLTPQSGSEAIYDENSQTLIVRDTHDNLEIVDSLIPRGCALGFFGNVVIEVTTFECMLPSSENMETDKWPTYSDLKKLPAASIRIVDSVSAVCRSGHRVSMRHVSNSSVTRSNDDEMIKAKEDAKSAGLFLDREVGTLVEAEPIIGPDGFVIDTSISYHGRFAAADNALSEINFITDFTCWENYPLVIYLSPLEKQPGKYIVITGNIRFVNYGGWKLKDPQSAENGPPVE